MALHECPGPTKKVPNMPEDIACPHCRVEFEMWTDDKRATCPSCKKEVTRAQLPRK